ncbi:hypothetical protein Ddye_021201 [Dipteronia dyeriana]|uniref:Uncharacterized protein n=1 Tax=Dipteronia dyeriana TaxID=168575 RepID=A0AAD9WWP4_9ROSI|nr:hypothetical protein Ddye_021201 [Dipteronia dyeriana]
MFNFVCKSSLFVRHWRHTTTLRASPTHEFQQCLPLSTTATTNQQSLTVSYLINTCGFPPESALSVSNKFKLKSPDNADAVISLFKSHGFSDTHVSKIIKSYPKVLLYDPEKTLLPKLEFFYSKGFSNHDLANIFFKFYPVLGRSLENHIIPTFNYLSNLLESQESAIVTIKRNPSVLYHDLQNCMEPKVNILLEYGVPKSNIFRYMNYLDMKYWSYSSRKDVKVFKEVVEEVKEMGIHPLRSQFIVAIGIKTALSRPLWESKVSLYKMWGWSEEECLEAFRRHPRFMQHSEDKIMAAMDFFVNKMGLKSSYISKHPIFVDYNLPKRLIPRASVFQFLLTKGLIKSKHARLVALFNYSEEAFLKKFVNSYDEAPQLLKLYKDKLDPPKITK